MARTETTGGEGSTRGRAVKRGRQEGGKYARYTEEQIEILEKVYAQCPNPNHVQRARIMREEPLLRGIDSKQLKVWFQNRRCRERQKKENGDLLSENKRLASSNKLLREENDGLQEKLNQLICENEQFQNQVLSLTSTVSTFNMNRQPEASNPQLPIRIADNNNSLLSLAEETKKEFLSKAMGNAINWIPVPWLKMHSPNPVGAFFVSSHCTGVAARGIATIPFEPTRAIEILKHRPTWCRHCRNMDVVAKHPASNGGTIELIYTQYYALTTLACARDFWTLRYTCGLDDGGFLVCERSISGSDAGPSSPVTLEFVRGKMLPSGYLIRPVEKGSTIYMVEDLDWEASSVPEVVRPLYESSELVAKKMIVAALHYIEHMDNEMNGRVARSVPTQDPAYLRPYGERVCRCFNDAVNCFSEDGWTLMNDNASNDVIMSVKRARHSGYLANYDSVICVRASVLLQNVFPASLVNHLKEHRADWMDFNFSDHSVAFNEAACYAFPGRNAHNLAGVPIEMARTNHQDEALEVVQFPSTDRPYLWDIYHMQMNNGLEDTGFGTCSELIFAPININLPDDAALFSSGFRFILLGTHTDPRLASKGTFSLTNGHVTGSYPPTMMVLAFQFPFEAPLQENIVPMARQYVQHVISSVKRIAAMMPLGPNRAMNYPGANRAPVQNMNYPGANWAPAQNISGVLPSGLHPQLNSTGANRDSMQNFFATRPGMSTTGTSAISVQNIFASYPGVSSSGATTAPVPNTAGVMPSRSYAVMNSTEAAPALVQNISGGVMPLASYSVMNMNSTQANPASVQNISGGIMPAGSYLVLNPNEANPASMQNIPGGIMLSGSNLGINSAGANPTVLNNISSGIGPSGSNLERNFYEANLSSVENISGGIMASGSNTEMNFTRTNPASVENIAGGVMPLGSYPEMNSIEANPAMDFGSIPELAYAANLANMICQSYRSTLGVDILGFNHHQTIELTAETVWHHPYAILCFSFSSLPVCLYANQAALNMLETTGDNLPNLTVDRILDGIYTLSLSSLLPTIMEQGYIILPPGQCMSVMNHFISYEQAVIWQVHAPDGSIHSLALACINWSFI